MPCFRPPGSVPACAFRFVLAAAVALATAACSTTGGSDVTGSIASAPSTSTPRTEAEWRRSLDMWGDRYKRDPNDVEAAIGYARALRATEQRAQAVAVLEQASIRNPNEMPLLGAYGRALADAGQYQQALDALGKAHTPDNPDWRILNAQGAVLDGSGRHADAQRHYTAALKIVPEEPSILSNLALSYVLMKKFQAGRGNAPSCGRAADCRAEGSGKSCFGRGIAGSLRRGRKDRTRRFAAQRGGSQCCLPAADARPAE